MKKAISIALIFVIVIGCFAGCAKPEKQILGTWKSSESALGLSIETTYVFNEDGTGTFSATSSLAVDMKWAIDDKTVTITTTVLGIESVKTYTYAFEKNTLTLTNGEEVTVLTKAE